MCNGLIDSSDVYHRSGNLISRDLSDLLKPEDAIETDYLTTLFVVVNK
jgi:hypothetical protein